MAIEAPGIHSWTFVAGADLRTKQYCFVKLHTDGTVIAIAAVTDNPVGILQNKPNSGEMAEVLLFGISKLKGNAAMTLGAYIGPHSDGKGAIYVHGTDTTKYIVGQVVPGGATTAQDGIGSVIFSCLGLGRAA